jgi:hypothetical protein
MRSRFPLISFACLVFLNLVILVSSASAQARPGIFVTPVPNAPFSGVVNVERSLVQPDGSVLSFKSIHDIHRDSQGRIYNESRNSVPASSTETPQVMSIHLYDPQTRISTMLYPGNRTFTAGRVPRPPSTVPPALFYASPTGNSLPPSEFAKEEDLGNKELSGLSVHGVRETQIIPADKSETGKEIVITDEYWYSNDLSINMVVKHSDPRSGAVSMTVTQVTRTEPDPALFQVPEGYTPPKPREQANQ